MYNRRVHFLERRRQRRLAKVFNFKPKRKDVMELSKTIEFVRVSVRADGQIDVRERTSYLEDGVVKIADEASRIIDVGDDMSNESALVQDIAAGGVFTVARKDARDAKKAEQAAIAAAKAALKAAQGG